MATNKMQDLEAALASIAASPVWNKITPRAPMTPAEGRKARAALDAMVRAAPKITCPLYSESGEKIGETKIAIFGGQAETLNKAA